MDEYKQITTDVLVHTANKRYYKIFLTVMYTPGYTSSVTESRINSDLTDYFNSLNFGANIQISDILQVAHNVTGVDNVRLSVPGDGFGYGIVELSPNGTQVGNVKTNDFSINDIDVAILNEVSITVKAQNTWKGLGV
jgi:hypothetical protein